tara:strand:+ start:122 stop:442 length:321 start_codon:yes stop_codon:yes gene_type:complete
MVKGVEMMDTKFCIFCGTHDPEYTVKEYTRQCNACGEGVVLTINEVVDLLNNLKSKGSITEEMLSYVTDQDYERGELDFDDDLLSVEEAIARDDAMRDMYDMDEEY